MYANVTIQKFREKKNQEKTFVSGYDHLFCVKRPDLLLVNQGWLNEFEKLSFEITKVGNKWLNMKADNDTHYLLCMP